jgi:hypothetical protein
MRCVIVIGQSVGDCLQPCALGTKKPQRWRGGEKRCVHLPEQASTVFYFPIDRLNGGPMGTARGKRSPYSSFIFSVNLKLAVIACSATRAW